jgi:hypothetical protein
MRPLRTLTTVLEMIKFGWFDVNVFVFMYLPYRRSRRVSAMSARRMISFAVVAGPAVGMSFKGADCRRPR